MTIKQLIRGLKEMARVIGDDAPVILVEIEEHPGSYVLQSVVPKHGLTENWAELSDQINEESIVEPTSRASLAARYPVLARSRLMTTKESPSRSV